jgi:holliday junction DNA helicase RuvB
MMTTNAKGVQLNEWADLPSVPVASRTPTLTATVAAPGLLPATADDRTRNPLRPRRFDDVIGQERVKVLLRRVVRTADEHDRPLDHLLLVGPSGVGKSTFAHVIANELDVDVYQLEAPVGLSTLLELREVMIRGDVLFIDEIHQQALAERRGKTADTQPEVLFSVMEDRKLISGGAVLDFPEITVMGATTDEGLLPDAFVNRFPLRPQLDGYTEADLARIAAMNAQALGVQITPDAALKFARASRGVPRQVNNYVRNAASLTGGGGVVDHVLADEVLTDLNRVTEDGLTLDMQRTLTFLYTRGKRVTNRRTTYQASIGTIATAIGKSRDSKAVTLRVEPFLIEKGYLQVGHGGRSLTPAGVKRAKELLA